MAEIGYKKLSANGGFYVYDTATNDIVKVDQTVYTILDDYFTHTSHALKDKYSRKMAEADLKSAMGYLSRAVERGMFKPLLKKDFSMYLDQGFLKKILSENLRFLLLGVTEQCNQRCRYCVYSGKYPGRRTHSLRRMTWDTAIRSIDYFLARNHGEERTSISFYGGEPLLEWDLVKRCVAHIRRRSSPERLTLSTGTNATLLNDEMIDFFIENDVVLFISLDGPARVHDAMRVFRNGRGTHKKVKEALHRIRHKNERYFQTRVCLLATYDEQYDLLDLCRYFSQGLLKDVSARMNHVRDLETCARSISEPESRGYQESLDRLLEAYLEGLRGNAAFNFSLISSVFPRVFRLIPQREIAPTHVMTRPNRACIPGISQLFVSADGLFYPCNHFCFPGYDIGDCRTGIDVEKVYRVLGTYVDFCDDMCQGCWAYRLCWHCFVQAVENGRLSQKKKAENCVKEKQNIVYDLKRFIYLLENEPKSALDNKFSLTARLRRINYLKKQKKEKDQGAKGGSRLRINDLPDESNLKVNKEQKRYKANQPTEFFDKSPLTRV